MPGPSTFRRRVLPRRSAAAFDLHVDINWLANGMLGLRLLGIGVGEDRFELLNVGVLPYDGNLVVVRVPIDAIPAGELLEEFRSLPSAREPGLHVSDTVYGNDSWH